MSDTLEYASDIDVSSDGRISIDGLIEIDLRTGAQRRIRNRLEFFFEFGTLLFNAPFESCAST